MNISAKEYECYFEYSLLKVRSKTAKVPRGIQGEKSRNTRQVRENWSQQLEHKQTAGRH